MQTLIFNESAALWAARVGTTDFSLEQFGLLIIMCHMEALKLKAAMHVLKELRQINLTCLQESWQLTLTAVVQPNHLRKTCLLETVI